jgi:hypothetical protein
MSSNLSTLPAGARATFAVLAAAQITLAVIALLDLYPRPTSQVVVANQWIWVPRRHGPASTSRVLMRCRSGASSAPHVHLPA